MTRRLRQCSLAGLVLILIACFAMSSTVSMHFTPDSPVAAEQTDTSDHDHVSTPDEGATTRTAALPAPATPASPVARGQVVMRPVHVPPVPAPAALGALRV